jgi:hypothetical protein
VVHDYLKVGALVFSLMMLCPVGGIGAPEAEAVMMPGSWPHNEAIDASDRKHFQSSAARDGARRIRVVSQEIFSVDEYTYGIILRGLWKDKDLGHEPEVMIYLATFFWNFEEICQRQPIEQNASLQELLHDRDEKSDSMTKFLSGFLSAQMNSRIEAIASLIRQSDRDPTLFILRHECDTPVAKQMRARLQTYIGTINSSRSRKGIVRDHLWNNSRGVPPKTSIDEDSSITVPLDDPDQSPLLRQFD